MAPSLVYGTANLQNSGSGTNTVTAPSCNTGDLLLIFVEYGNTSPVLGAGGVTGGSGSSWSELPGFPVGGTGCSLTVLGKVAAAGDSGAVFTVNFNVSTQKSIAWVVVASDPNGTPVTGNTGAGHTGSGTSMTTASMNVSLNSLVIAFFITKAGTLNSSSPATWTGTAAGLVGTERDDQTNINSSQTQAELQDGNGPVTGAGTVTAAATSAASLNWAAGMVEIQPASTAQPGSGTPSNRPGLSRIKTHRGAWRQQIQQVLTSGDLTVTAGLATSTGTAGQAVAGITSTPQFLATAAGGAAQPGTELGIGLATAIGAAVDQAQATSPPDPVAHQPQRKMAQQRRYRRRQQPMQIFVPAVLEVDGPALVCSGFGTFPQVPPNSLILEVVANVTQYGSDPQILAPAYELWDGTTAIIGTRVTGSPNQIPGVVDVVVFSGPVTYSQLATLQLKIFGRSQGGNSGATLNVDSAALAISWAPNADATATPDTLAIAPQFPPVQVQTDQTVSPATLAVTPAFPALTTGFLAAAIFPATLNAPVALPPPVASSSILINAGVLAITAQFPPISDITGPGYAASEVDGGWTNPGNVTGPPDGNNAVWTVP